MAKPSGVKITYAISQLATWFGKEVGYLSLVSFTADSGGGPPYPWNLMTPYICKSFRSFSAMRKWMEREVRRRRVLFRKWG